MPTPEELYDFESVIPRAVRGVLEDLGLTVATIEDEQKFQKVRPRVEVVYRQIGEVSPKRLAVLSDGTKRTSCFRGELKLHAITDADSAGKLVHSSYRAKVRNAIAVLENSVNETQLTLHKIQFVVSGNEETGIRNSDGYQQTTFPFTIDISIQKDAWETLS